MSFKINSIKLENWTCFDHLEIEFKSPSDRGQWIVLLGDNGSGKTTILNAIAFTLADVSIARMVLSWDAFPIIRFGESQATCIINNSFSACAQSKPPSKILTRHCSYLDRLYLLVPDDFAKFISTFIGDRNFDSILDCLKDLKLRSLHDSKYQSIYSTILSKLRDPLLPGIECLEIHDDQVFVVRQASNETIPLNCLDGGYRIILELVIRLMMGLLLKAQCLGHDIFKVEFFDTIESVVLVDGIDSHLHPHWQRTIIRSLKQAFPQTTFVVTVYNPLTLLGTDPGEVVVLQNNGSLRAQQIDIPPGVTSDRVYTGPWFELPSTVDDSTLKLIQEHQQMLIAGVSQDDPKRVMLEQELANSFGSYADTSIERMALEVAAELMRESQPKTANEREVFQKRLRNCIRLRQHQK